MLSAMEYGNRGAQTDRPNAFSDLTDFDRAVEFMARYVRISEGWTRERGVLISRYENLLGDYDTEAGRLAGFLGLDTASAAVKDAIVRYRPESAEGRQGTHFVKGRIGRFRQVFSPDQQRALAERFGAYLRRMGYAV